MQYNIDSTDYAVELTAVNLDVAVTSGVPLDVTVGESARLDVGEAVNYIKSGQAEIAAEVKNTLNVFNTNAAEKTRAFNVNAADKITEFNNNASAKTVEFNNNADDKTTVFNTNVSNKTDEFNDNYADKLSAFDSNASDKTAAFDLNAGNKTTAFNDNATAKTTDFNNNYTAKKALIDAEVANASASATAADNSATESKQWAIGDPSEPSGNSSKYWAEQAASTYNNKANIDLSNLSASGEAKFNAKQDTLVSGTNIKTINNQSLLGSGNIDIAIPDSATWGNITGDIADQTDLQEALDTKQKLLTSANAGTDIEITGSSVINTETGNGSVTFTAVDNTVLTSVQLTGGTAQNTIPKGYKRVESLTTDGVAYLETPYAVYSVDRVQGTVSFTQLVTGSGLQYVVGGRAGSTSGGVAVGYCVYAPSHGGLTYYPMSWKADSVGISATTGVDYVFDTTVVSQSTIKLIINDSVRQDTTMTNSKGSVAGTNKICLFSLTNGSYNQEGTTLKDEVVFYGTDGEILAYYIFVERESDNALGALNLLDGSFITNDEGTFTKGAYVADTAYPVQVVPTPTNSVDITCNNGVISVSPDLFVDVSSDINWSTSSVIVYSPVFVGNGTFTLSTPDYLDDSTYTNMFFLAGNVSSGESSSSNGVYKGKTVSQTAVDGYVTFATRASVSGRDLGDPKDYTWYLRKTDEYIVTGTVETIKDSIGNDTNLLEATTTLGGTLKSTSPVGGNGTANNKRCRIEYQYLPAGTYTLSNNGETVNQALGCTYSDEQGNDGAILDDTAFNWKILPWTFTLTENCYVRFMCSSSEATTLSASNVGEFLITQNDNTATAENLLYLNETYKDTQEVLTGTVTRTIGVKVLDGTEGWTAASSGVYTQFPLLPETENRLDAYCTHFVYNKNADTINGLTSGEFTFSRTSGVTTKNCSFKDSTVTTSVATWKAFLAEQYAAGTPVIVVYQLAETTTETVTAQSLNIQEGSNTFTITQASLPALPLAVSYKEVSDNVVISFTNDSGFITGINSSDVINALGYTPYNSNNPDGYITGSDLTSYALNDEVVHNTGTEDIGGSKTFTSAISQNITESSQGRIITTLNDIQVGTSNPQENYMAGIVTKDRDGNEFANINTQYRTDGQVRAYFFVTNPVSGGGQQLGIINSGGVSWGYAPNSDVNGSIVTTASKFKSYNGYFKLGNDLIVQWGGGSVAANASSATITFPTPFTTTNYTPVPIHNGGVNALSISSRTTTSFVVNYSSTSTAIRYFYWQAIGY